MAVTNLPTISHLLRNRIHPPTGRKGVKNLPPPPKPAPRTNKPPTSGRVQKGVKVLGRRPKPNKKLTPSAQVLKVRTFEAEQKAKRLAAARYQNKGTGAQAPAVPPPVRRFKRGGNTLY